MSFTRLVERVPARDIYTEEVGCGRLIWILTLGTDNQGLMDSTYCQVTLDEFTLSADYISLSNYMSTVFQHTVFNTGIRRHV